MANDRNGISKGVLRAMSMFGGVQALSIICSIIRTKLVAIWIGPAGIGLFGLYNTAIDMINNIANLGIRSSSIRDISIANSKGSRKHIAEVIAVVRRWTWTLGIIAAFVTLIASPLLSIWTFGDNNHTLGFIALSATIMFAAVVNCEQSILQGTGKLKRLAKTSVWGTVAGLAISVPLFYFFREDSIVPSIIAYSAATAFFAWKFRNKDYSGIKVSLPAREVMTQGAGFVKLGFFMTVSSFLSILSSFLFITYLNHTSGTETVGYYQAGYTLVNRYAAIIFSAIGMEYYPRLSRVAHSRIRTQMFVSQEINITLSILAPVIALFLLFRELIISLLYSSAFHAIIPFISLASIGIAFQSVSWCMAFVIIAKGKGKTYLVTESISAVTGILLNISFYHFGGLQGLGLSYIVWYILYTITVGIVYARLFKLSLHKTAILSTLHAIIVATAAYIGMETGYKIITIIVAIASAIFGIYNLRRMTR